MVTVGFLHTSPVHVPTFRALLADIAPAAAEVNVVDEALLADARAGAAAVDIEKRLLGQLRDLASRGSDVVVCTCSTLAGQAERLADQLPIPVLRVDRAMAEAAVAGGERVGVVAAVESTVGPTRQLLEECAAAAGTGAVVVDAPCLDAWALFERGDQAGYLDRIAAHVRDLVGVVEVVVLAQASMARAADLLSGVPLRVLSSPRPAVTRAVELADT